MEKLKITLKNCYGIKKFCEELDFEGKSTIAIYASNGTMKTSFAKTFYDLSQNGKDSEDLIDKTKTTIREIKDENDKDLDGESVFVVKSHDDVKMPKESSTLMVHDKLQNEYTKIIKTIEEMKNDFLDKLKLLSGIRVDIKNVEERIKKDFDEDDFFQILEQSKFRIDSSINYNVKYEKIFNDKFLQILNNSDFKKYIKDYTEKYKELLENSKYLKLKFNHYNANEVKKKLDGQGFFAAKHSINLKHESEIKEIKSADEFIKIIDKEQKEILNDPVLKGKIVEITKLMHGTPHGRELLSYLMENQHILPELNKPNEFSQKLWISYFNNNHDKYNELVQEYENKKNDMEKIIEESKSEETTWKTIIKEFNNRFTMPFKIIVKNESDTILKKNIVPRIEYKHEESQRTFPENDDDLFNSLSTGEKKAWNILNILFNIKIRQNKQKETLLIFDDIVDSFDYRNKYAIIKYIEEISRDTLFKIIILTHNFDFFRTIISRHIVERRNSYFVTITNDKCKLAGAHNVCNVFVKEFIPHFDEPKKFIASIPFARNIIEYTNGKDDENYKKLTSLLHYREDTKNISFCTLKNLFKCIFPIIGDKFPSCSNDTKILDMIHYEAKKCLNETDGINFENKIILSIAIRLKAEKYMIKQIGWDIPKNDEYKQYDEKFKKYIKELEDVKIKNILEEVYLITPENIHLNSFMYEPILDMSDKHLIDLYTELSKL